MPKLEIYTNIYRKAAQYELTSPIYILYYIISLYILLSQILMAQIEDLNEGRVKFHVCIFHNLRKTAAKDRYGQVWSDFIKVLELLECRRGNPYMTANRNFVCFAHSQISGKVSRKFTLISDKGFPISMYWLNPDWKQFSDQTYSCPTDFRLLLSWGPNWGPPWNLSSIIALLYWGV